LRIAAKRAVDDDTEFTGRFFGAGPLRHQDPEECVVPSPIGVPEAICRSFLDLVLTGKIERDWLGLFGQVFAKWRRTFGAPRNDIEGKKCQRTQRLRTSCRLGEFTRVGRRERSL
jgi:hypothetical protein